MIILTSAPARSLELLLEGAAATAEIEWDVSWTDYDAAAPGYGPAGDSGLSNGATPVTVLAAPGAGVTRHVKHWTACNTDTADHTVTVQLRSAGTAFEKYVTLLLAGDTLEYNDGSGLKYLLGKPASSPPVVGGGGGLALGLFWGA